MQPKQFLHTDCPVLTANCLFKTKQKKVGGSWKEKEFMPGNENALLYKSVSVVVLDLFTGLNCQIACTTVYIFVDFLFFREY